MFSEWGVRAGVLGRGHEGSGSLGGGGVNREKILATRAPRLEVKICLVFFCFFDVFSPSPAYEAPWVSLG